MSLSRRQFLRGFTATAASAMVLNHCTSYKLSGKRPNIIFFLVDDLGWTDVGYNGATLYETPNVDDLANQGMRFTAAYSAGSVCSPTRASIMTGKHPARLNITDWIPGMRPMDRPLIGPEIENDLPLTETTIANVLKENGYQNWFVGKWHLGGPGYYPKDQGFDVNIGGFEKGSPPGGYFSPYRNPKLKDGPKDEYLTDRLTREAIDLLKTRRSDSPFFLMMSYYTVHTPIQAKPGLVEKYERKLKTMNLPDIRLHQEHDVGTRIVQDNAAYAAMVQSMDESVGEIMQTLRELGLEEDTIVIFTSDNGGLSTKPGEVRPTSNEPLRAGKGWLYEGGIRVPLVIKWPGMTKQGSACYDAVISCDFYPTLLQMTGLEPMPLQHLDGTSLVPLLRGKETLKRDALYWHFPHYHGSGARPSGAIRSKDFKLIEYFEDGQIELYDLLNDLRESNNLAKEMPKKARDLLEKMQEWRAAVDAKMPVENPNAPDSNG